MNDSAHIHLSAHGLSRTVHEKCRLSSLSNEKQCSPIYLEVCTRRLGGKLELKSSSSLSVEWHLITFPTEKVWVISPLLTQNVYKCPDIASCSRRCLLVSIWRSYLPNERSRRHQSTQIRSRSTGTFLTFIFAQSLVKTTTSSFCLFETSRRSWVSFRMYLLNFFLNGKELMDDEMKRCSSITQKMDWYIVVEQGRALLELYSCIKNTACWYFSNVYRILLHNVIIV